MKLKLKMALLEMQSRYYVVDWCLINFEGTHFLKTFCLVPSHMYVQS